MGLVHSPRIATNDLIFCVDALNSKSYPGSGSTWSDLSIIRNNGTLQNNPTYDSAGYFTFNGTTQFVSFADLNPSLTNVNIYTLSLWCKLSSLNTEQIIWAEVIANGFGDNDGIFDIGILSTGRIRYSYNSTNQLDFNYIPNTTDWFNLAVTKNGGGGTGIINLYVNGVLDGTVSNAQSIPGVASVQHNIGKPAQNVRYFSGSFAQCAFYNRALTAEEIQQNFNAFRGRFGV
jgi:hypothetical protein